MSPDDQPFTYSTTSELTHESFPYSESTDLFEDTDVSGIINIIISLYSIHTHSFHYLLSTTPKSVHESSTYPESTQLFKDADVNDIINILHMTL